MHIFIPTRGRAAHQVTWTQLPAPVRLKTELLVDAEEVDEYLHRAPSGVRVRAMPRDVRGIGAVRQHACDIAVREGDGLVLMMDDDLRFYIRREDMPDLLVKATERDIEDMFSTIQESLSQYPLVGVAGREGANRVTEPLIENTRILRLLAYDAALMQMKKVRFDRIPVMEDFDVALQLLELGHPNLLLNTWAHNQEGSGVRGGCSAYRTPEVQAQAAHALAALHPGLVRVTKKVTKGAWGGGERTDVVIAWKKAFRSKVP